MKYAFLVVLVATAACGEHTLAGADDTGRCTTAIQSGDRCDPANGVACTWSEGIDGGTSPLHRCDCFGDIWRCVTVDHPCAGGGIPSSEATCNPGDSCDYSDWEHDCFCRCAVNHRWDCTPGTIGSYQVCPRAYLDAGVDAP